MGQFMQNGQLPPLTPQNLLDPAGLQSMSGYGFSAPAWGGAPNALQGVPPPQYGPPVTFGDQMGDFFKGAIGTKEAPGWGNMAIGGATALFNGWLGMQQYGLAKKTLAENKRQFDMNYGAQKTTTNAALEDRQRARVASNAGAYQSVGDYMNQNGIK